MTHFSQIDLDGGDGVGLLRRGHVRNSVLLLSQGPLLQGKLDAIVLEHSSNPTEKSTGRGMEASCQPLCEGTILEADSPNSSHAFK